MTKITRILAIVAWTLTAVATFAETIPSGEVFVVPVKPETFGWKEDEKLDHFTFEASLLNYPDLPSWIHYVFSKRHHHGFLYGVAPSDIRNFQIEIVALNNRNYETKYKVLDFNVSRSSASPKYEIQVKIDNLDVEEMFDWNKTNSLLDIFRSKLWRDSKDMRLTMLISAVHFGARLPLNPNEGEGVVVRIGSSMQFSQELIKLQEEVRPLWKVCPKGIKRTTVERLFREAGFTLDWCAFKLTERQESRELYESSVRKGGQSVISPEPSFRSWENEAWQWSRLSKSDMPTRDYWKELATTVFLPSGLLLILAALLGVTAICIDNEKTQKPEPSPVEGVGSNGVHMVQYVTSDKTILRSVSTQPPSPTESLSRSPRTQTGNPYVRPNPPPYISPVNYAGSRVDF